MPLVLLTGATCGIGAAAVVELAREGSRSRSRGKER
jgi:NAD(P)-dependent dehydrogenase (short-subunit alcohol dehydrogenase family)